MVFRSTAADAALGPGAAGWTLAWATLGLAVSTVVAVVVGVATTRTDRTRADAARVKDAEDADRRLREQLVHSDKRLAGERAAADERLRRQLAQVEEIEQRGEAAAVQVIAFGVHAADGAISISEYPYFRPVIIVRNHGRYSISNVHVKFSDGSSILGSALAPSFPELSDEPDDEPADWTSDAIISLGSVYRGNIAPGGAMRFEYDTMAQDALRTAFPIVRWDDRWDECWEYRRGVAYLTDRGAEWRAEP
jgi:hypothetical protein